VNAPRVYVHIDAIALRGIDAAQRDQLVGSLRAELARQFATGHAAMASRSVTSLSGGRMALAHGASASHIGREAARRIVRSVRA
jgi:hypothetical protein